MIGHKSMVVRGSGRVGRIGKAKSSRVSLIGVGVEHLFYSLPPFSGFFISSVSEIYLAANNFGGSKDGK